MSQIKRAVSLYSLQDSYAMGRLDLAGQVEFVASLGAEGIETIGDQSFPGTPFPSDETVSSWRRMVDAAGLELVCNDVLLDSALYRNRTLTIPEQVDLLKQQLDVSKRLGYPMIRLTSDVSDVVTETALPYAEQLGVVMTAEIHGGMSFDEPRAAKWIEMMKRVQSEYLGLTIDFGIFCDRHPRLPIEYFRTIGLTPAVADRVEELWAEHGDFHQYLEIHHHQFPDDLKALFRSGVDFEFCIFAGGYENTSLDVLTEYRDYIKHFHGKFFEMLPDGTEFCIDVPAILTRLNEIGWSGYIASEYEGNRFTPIGQDVDDQGQLRTHQELLAAHIDDGK